MCGVHYLIGRGLALLRPEIVFGPGYVRIDADINYTGSLDLDLAVTPTPMSMRG